MKCHQLGIEKVFGEIREEEFTRKDGEILTNQLTKYWLQIWQAELFLALMQTK